MRTNNQQLGTRIQDPGTHRTIPSLQLSLLLATGCAGAAPVVSWPTSTNTNSIPSMSRTQAEAALQEALGVRPLGSNRFAVGEVIIDAHRRTVTFPARVNMRRAVIEYALVTSYGKTHESLLATDVQPQQVHLACLLLGLAPRQISGPPDTAEPVPATNAVAIEVSWDTPRSVRHRLSELVSIKKPNTEEPGAPLSRGPWYYNGSLMAESGFAAQVEGSIISLIRDPAALMNNPRRERDDDELHVPNTKWLPPEGAPVRVVLSFLPKGR